MTIDLPYAPRDVVRFGTRDAIAIDAVCRFASLTGLWRYPARARGDVAEMRFLDWAYWIYKSSHPIRNAEKHSGVEEMFAAPQHVPALPVAFEPTATLRVAAVGDLMNHAYLAGSPDLYRDVDDLIFGADVAMANLECVVIDESERLDIRGRANAGPALAMGITAFHNVAARYTFLATACNHSIDFGSLGVASTIAAIRSAGIAFHGVNEHERDADNGTIVERNGFRVGVVSHTFGVNGHPKPPDRPRIVNHTQLNREPDQIDFRLLQSQLARCQDHRADFVIAQLHWGMEFEMYPRRAQVAVAHRIAELGADAIIGHHPHVPQPFELYRCRRDADRIVPIFYSLGNLTNPFSIEFMCRSAVAQLELARGKRRDGVMQTYVANAHMDQVEQFVSGHQVRLRARNDIDIFGHERRPITKDEAHART